MMNTIVNTGGPGHYTSKDNYVPEGHPLHIMAHAGGYVLIIYTHIVVYIYWR